jgi:peptidyl-prolyl cis-trans isomerase C
MLSKWLREPLLHFLLIGTALFVFYGLQDNEPKDKNYNNQIVIGEADVSRLIVRWEKKWQRPPTQDELNGMIEQQVREQVLYREALALGLDKNDPVVRRRLAQKIEFISSDLAAQIEPSESQLSRYFTDHPDKFEIPARLSFVQVYLNTDRRGDQSNQDASQLLNELSRDGSQIDITTVGDPFMFDQSFENLTEHGISRLFGSDFAIKLFKLPLGSWQGPVESGYGLHLVRINHLSESLLPELDTIREEVRDEWLIQQRQTLDEAFYQILRQRFDIVTPNAPKQP